MDYLLAIGIVFMFASLFAATVFLLVYLADMAWTVLVDWMNR